MIQFLHVRRKALEADFMEEAYVGGTTAEPDLSIVNARIRDIVDDGFRKANPKLFAAACPDGGIVVRSIGPCGVPGTQRIQPDLFLFGTLWLEDVCATQGATVVGVLGCRRQPLEQTDGAKDVTTL